MPGRGARGSWSGREERWPPGWLGRRGTKISSEIRDGGFGGGRLRQRQICARGVKPPGREAKGRLFGAPWPGLPGRAGRAGCSGPVMRRILPPGRRRRQLVQETAKSCPTADRACLTRKMRQALTARSIRLGSHSSTGTGGIAPSPGLNRRPCGAGPVAGRAPRPAQDSGSDSEPQNPAYSSCLPKRLGKVKL